MIVFTSPPKNFIPGFEIAVLFGENAGNFLFLLRNDHETAPNKWCLPGGGIHVAETPLQALIREIKEETAIDLARDQVVALTRLYEKHPEYGNYVVHPFYYQFQQKPAVQINYEHKDFRWVDIEEALLLDTILGTDEGLQIFKNQEWPLIQKKIS